jgi:hypothetical protein
MDTAMKRLALILFFLLAPSAAFPQCSGVFSAGTVCGNVSLVSATPTQVPFSVVLTPTVQQLGAKCDGVTDDTAILNTIFNSANGVVNFGPSAQGCVFSSIVYTQQKSLYVESPGGCATPLKQVTATGVAAFNFAIPLQTAKVTVHNACFATPTGAGAGVSGDTAIAFINANGSVLDNVFIQRGFYRGVVITTSYGTTIKNSRIGDAIGGTVDYGVFYNADSSANNSIIENSLFQNNGITNHAPAIFVSGCATCGPGSSELASYGFTMIADDMEGNYSNLELRRAYSVGIRSSYFDNLYTSGGGVYPGYQFYCDESCGYLDIRVNWFGAAATTNLDNLSYINFDKNTLYNSTMVVSGTTLNFNCGDNKLLGTGTISGSCNALVAGVYYPPTPSVNQVPVVTSTSPYTITYKTVPNTSLANSATTVNGQTCTLGSTCTVPALTPNSYLIGSLPTCSTNTGLLAYVTNGEASPTFNATVSTTGSANQLVWCNGTNWTYH